MRLNRPKITDLKVPMERDGRNKARLAALREEAEAIHAANTVYWTSDNQSGEAAAEYYRRLNRLEEIRKEFDRLTNSPADSRGSDS
jgi:hypothetical protein